MAPDRASGKSGEPGCISSAVVDAGPVVLKGGLSCRSNLPDASYNCYVVTTSSSTS